ncbi:MAG: hypothetical protein HKN82_14415 [Akkermansiaceae bacterium]|nr:hypothetical protein [Akkermansiaceae bacterium]
MSSAPHPPRPLEEIFAPIGGHKNGCTLAEYLHFAREVRARAPARLLVFGVGEDSAAWIEANAGGTTLFLEDNPEWIGKIAATTGGRAIRQVRYALPFDDWAAADYALEALALPDPAADLADRSWDLAFVDGPWGPTTGRHQSTFAATRAVRAGGLVALHDCERDREQLICRHILEAQGFETVSEVERLRLYRAPA